MSRSTEAASSAASGAAARSRRVTDIFLTSCLLRRHYFLVAHGYIQEEGPSALSELVEEAAKH